MPPVSRLLSAALVVAFPFVNSAGAAEPPQRYNQISFQVETSRPVENDRMHAVLAVTVEDDLPARLADTVNRTMDWAVKLAKAQPKVEFRTSAYRTHPVIEKEKIRRWRASQELTLEGTDFARLGELIGKLQERLQVASLSFMVSPERRRQVEDELITQALGAFQARATLVRRQLAAKGHRVVNLAINTSGTGSLPVRMRAEGYGIVSKSSAPPALEAGTSTLSVNVNGVIELQ